MPSHYSTRDHTRDHFGQASSLVDRIIAALPGGLAAQVQRVWDRQKHNSVSTHGLRIPRSFRNAQRWNPKRLLSLPHLFVAVWVLLLLWGERWVFESAVQACEWERWERWPKEATPHHLVFIADPQLIDPHTYPDRLWLAQKLTILHVDNYLKRSYIQLSKLLHPDTLFFLGDLFDGGREWKTAHGNTADPAWASGLRPSGEQKYVKKWGKRYGENFWLHEYNRFGRIFYDFWNLGGSEAGPWQRGRKIISTLPGNHDLGFGAQIKVPVRNRFEAYFGEGNRVDVIGNHTFVSVDSVSLSAGSSEHGTKELTQPSEDFLNIVQSLKRKAVARELNLQAGNEKLLQFVHKVEDLEEADFTNRPTLDPGPSGADLPTILLTHVPLYRGTGTPCGPKREHWPPTPPPKGQTTPVQPDERNALSITGGYQYQNVLSEEDSVKLVSTIGNVVSVFSGDDHDYCEIVHSAEKNHAREITVKSMSWAMGVRKPGFLMLSMWNPIGPDGQPLHSSPTGHGAESSQSTTMQSHLCLLPDQLGIFIKYAILIVITILALLIRAILVPILNLEPFSPYQPTDSEETLLPTTNRESKRNPDTEHRSSNSNSSSSSANLTNLAPRTSAARTRSVSPANGYGLPASQVRFATPPLASQPGSYAYTPHHDEDFGKLSKRSSAYDSGVRRKKLGVLELVWREAWHSVFRVTWIVVCIYLYFVWYG